MKIRIGTRESRLAVIQAEIAAALLRGQDASLETEIVTMRTSGDILKDRPLDTVGGKGLFTRELDKALLEGRIDMAVHSLKDMPAALPAGLIIAAFCAGEDPRDALILPAGAAELDVTKPIGCSAKRRSVQLAPLIPGVRCVFVRGNVPTRLAKLDAGEYGALVLALAGLKRLGLEGRASRIFSIEEMLPAAGQGILAVVTREEGDSARLADAIDDPALRRRAIAERTFTRMLDGGCGLPVAAFAREEGGELILEGRFRQENEDAVSGGVLRGDPAKPEDLGRRLAFRLLAETARRNRRLGSVCLAGAGPGDPGLLTARSAAALAEADVVVFDKLVGPGVLAAIPPGAEKIYAGKESGHHSLPQEEINAILVKKAAAGLRVLRLKGGDPLLFGRGSEEALCLMDAGIRCEILSGVSSALAAPGSAGIPLTHRGVSSRLHIIAAHGEGSRTIDFSVLARQCAAGDTLVFLMGAARLEHLCANLGGAGLPGDTPAAVVSNGTTAKQLQAISTLAGLADSAARAGIEAPAVIVVGDVCRLNGDFSFRAEKPLRGVRIAVTRPRGGVNRLSALLDAAGAEVIALPVIRIAPRAEAPLLREVFARTPLTKIWFAFTSVHGAEAFFEKLSEYRVDIRALAACKFAAVGDATCASLAARGLIADLTPEIFTGTALGVALAKNAAKDETVILPRSSIGGREIPDTLDAAGLEYLDIPLYDTVPETGYENPAFRARLVEGLDYAAFTSPSAVEGFAVIFGNRDVPALCIGEATAAPARALGMNVIVPETASLEGMVEALVALRQKEGS
jgi:uroporphyrinogen III methyltransferase/synthase